MSKSNQTIVRMDKILLNKIAKMRLPIKKNSRNVYGYYIYIGKESYADVLSRLLKKHWAEMQKEKRGSN